MKKITLKNGFRLLALVLTLSCMLSALGGCGNKDEEWITSEIIIEEDVPSNGDTSVETSDNSSGSGNVQSGSSDQNQAQTSSGSSKNASPDKLKNPNITIFWPMTISDHPEFTALNKAFEEKYGGRRGDRRNDQRDITVIQVQFEHELIKADHAQLPGDHEDHQHEFEQKTFALEVIHVKPVCRERGKIYAQQRTRDRYKHAVEKRPVQHEVFGHQRIIVFDQVRGRDE